MKAERQQKERTSRVMQLSKDGGGNIVDNRPQVVYQTKMINSFENTSPYLSDKVIQCQVSKIEIKDESVPVLGHMNYAFKWSATGDSHSNGYIVQHITRTETTVWPVKKTDIFDYWEAWRVDGSNIYNGDVALSNNTNHDSWYQEQMPPETQGQIIMNGDVFFATSVTGMSFNGVTYAGGLLSSETKPTMTGEEHINNFPYTFNWNRRLEGPNIDEIVKREWASFGVMYDHDTLIESIDDILEEINKYDPAHEIQKQDLPPMLLRLGLITQEEMDAL